MIRLISIFTLALLLLSGCSSSASDSAKDGESIYNSNCAACHGDQLQGAVGPAVKDMKSKYSEADLQDLILKGTPKMPGNLVDEEDAKLVTQWLLEK